MRWTDRSGRPELLFCENETNTRRLYGMDDRRLLQGRHQRLSSSTATRRGQPGATAPNAPPMSCSTAGRRQRPTAAALRLRDRARRRRSPISTRSSPAPAPRPTSSTPRCSTTSPIPTRGWCSGRRWPACSGPSSSTTSTSALARRRPGAAAAAAGAPARSQHRLGTSEQRRHHLDAGHLGISRGTPPGTWRSIASPFALIDPEFAKAQLLLLTREWYMHPNGQLPAYEWAFGDVNPPVHAWAAWRVYRDRPATAPGTRRPRLPGARVPQADAELHLVGEPQGRARAATCSRAASSASTISACSTARSRCRPAATSTSPTAPPGWRCTRSTCCASRWSWRCTIHVYEDIATKFFEHFLYIADAMTNIGGDGIGLWDEADEFYLRRAAPARRRAAFRCACARWSG